MKPTRLPAAFSARLAAVLAIAASAWSAPVMALSITEFTGVLAGTAPNVITLGPDGALWYTEFGHVKNLPR